MNTFRLFSFISIALLFSCAGTTLKCMETERIESEKLNEALEKALITLAESKKTDCATSVLSQASGDEEPDEVSTNKEGQQLDEALDRWSKNKKNRGCLSCFCK